MLYRNIYCNIVLVLFVKYTIHDSQTSTNTYLESDDRVTNCCALTKAVLWLMGFVTMINKHEMLTYKKLEKQKQKHILRQSAFLSF